MTRFRNAALLVLCAHVLLLWKLGTQDPFWSNLAQLVMALLATATCSLAAAKRQGAERRFCWLAAGSFLLWSIAQTGWLYHESRYHTAVPTVSPINVLFFFFLAPLGLAIFLPSDRDDAEGPWAFRLDFIQLGVVLLTTYLYFFYVPTFWQGREPELNQAIRQASEWRNVFLTAGLLFRAIITPAGPLRRLFAKFSIVFALYAVGESLLFHLTPASIVNTGQWFDLTWSLPFALAIYFVAGEPVEEPSPAEQPRSPKVSIAFQLMPALIPLLVLFTAARIVRDQVQIAAGAVLLSFACYSLRLYLTQQHADKYLEALHTSEMTFSLAFKQSPNVMALSRLTDGRLLEVNDAGVAFYGGSREDLIGKTAPELNLWAHPEQREKYLNAMVEQGKVREMEVVLRRKSGEFRTVVANGDVIQIGGEPVMLVTCQDVTESRALEKKLLQSQKMEAVGALAGGIAHDFNNLLTVITGYSTLAKDKTAHDPMLSEELEQIQQAAKRATALTSQLLSFSRQQVSRRSVMSLNSSLRGMEKMLKRVIGEDIELQMKLDPSIPAIVADPVQIDQITMNLTVNARDAMHSGGKIGFVTSSLRLQERDPHRNLEAGSYVILTVTDTGTGMDRGTLAHIFEPFFTTKEVGKGTGLGLSTVYDIMQDSGGSISAASEPGRGTTFTLYFPASAADESKAAAGPGESVEQGSETILLVEDDESLRRLSSTVLDNAGYTVYAASGVEDAERIFHEVGPAIKLVITDVVMPDGGGVKLVTDLTQQRPDMKVLFVSGYTDGKVPQEYLKGDHPFFLAKPFQPLELAKKVRQVLDQQATVAVHSA